MGHDAYDKDALDDCKKRAHAFISRSEEAEEVTLPGWLARKISAYILYLEGPHACEPSPGQIESERGSRGT
jgi:hypothetical protein